MEGQPFLPFNVEQFTWNSLGVVKISLYYFGASPVTVCWGCGILPPSQKVLLDKTTLPAPTVPHTSAPPPEARAYGRLIAKHRPMKFRTIITCECGDRMKAEGPV